MKTKSLVMVGVALSLFEYVLFVVLYWYMFCPSHHIRLLFQKNKESDIRDCVPHGNNVLISRGCCISFSAPFFHFSSKCFRTFLRLSGSWLHAVLGLILTCMYCCSKLSHPNWEMICSIKYWLPLPENKTSPHWKPWYPLTLSFWFSHSPPSLGLDYRWVVFIMGIIIVPPFVIGQLFVCEHVIISWAFIVTSGLSCDV